MLLNFGQPIQGIVQFAYIISDIEKAMAEYARNLKVGPWFYAESYSMTDAIYRGSPSKMNMSLAIGFAGHMSIELIQQNDDEPSVYREVREKSGFGFHHWGIATRSFDEDLAAYRALGHEVAFSARSPRGIRLAYLDSTRDLPGMLELIEFSDAQEKFYTTIFNESLQWNGADPIRRM